MNNIIRVLCALAVAQLVSSQQTVYPSSPPTMAIIVPPLEINSSILTNLTSMPSIVPSSLPSWVRSSSPSKFAFVPPETPGVLDTNLTSIAPNEAASISPTSSPDSFLSKIPTSTPTMSKSVKPSTLPTTFQSGVPTSLHSSIPSEFPTTIPSTHPTTAFPSVSTSSTPTIFPSVAPSTLPSEFPSIVPTTPPSFIPSEIPTTVPSRRHTTVPSFSPSGLSFTTSPSTPTSSNPSILPTVVPSGSSSTSLSGLPSSSPKSVQNTTSTLSPSISSITSFSASPSQSNKNQTLVTSFAPSISTTYLPTVAPSILVSKNSTSSPSSIRSTAPSVKPSTYFNPVPSIAPDESPSANHTLWPTLLQSALPSFNQSTSPTIVPSVSPSTLLSGGPSSLLTSNPSVLSTLISSINSMTSLSADPTLQPSSVLISPSPSIHPTVLPKLVPSTSPSTSPMSSLYSSIPSSVPSLKPTILPSFRPSVTPTQRSRPSSEPSYSFKPTETTTDNTNIVFLTSSVEMILKNVPTQMDDALEEIFRLNFEAFITELFEKTSPPIYNIETFLEEQELLGERYRRRLMTGPLRQRKLQVPLFSLRVKLLVKGQYTSSTQYSNRKVNFDEYLNSFVTVNGQTFISQLAERDLNYFDNLVSISTYSALPEGEVGQATTTKSTPIVESSSVKIIVFAVIGGLVVVAVAVLLSWRQRISYVSDEMSADDSQIIFDQVPPPVAGVASVEPSDFEVEIQNISRRNLSYTKDSRPDKPDDSNLSLSPGNQVDSSSHDHQPDSNTQSEVRLSLEPIDPKSKTMISEHRNEVRKLKKVLQEMTKAMQLYTEEKEKKLKNYSAEDDVELISISSEILDLAEHDQELERVPRTRGQQELIKETEFSSSEKQKRIRESVNNILNNPAGRSQTLEHIDTEADIKSDDNIDDLASVASIHGRLIRQQAEDVLERAKRATTLTDSPCSVTSFRARNNPSSSFAYNSVRDKTSTGAKSLVANPYPTIPLSRFRSNSFSKSMACNAIGHVSSADADKFNNNGIASSPAKSNSLRKISSCSAIETLKENITRPIIASSRSRSDSFSNIVSTGTGAMEGLTNSARSVIAASRARSDSFAKIASCSGMDDTVDDGSTMDIINDLSLFETELQVNRVVSLPA